jgi:uncharacterized protein
MRHVEIILKVAERCNLNCTYCYFFNKENKDFENNPALISAETSRNLVRFLRSSSQGLSETVFDIDIHGGEPLLLGPKRFSELVSIIANGLHDAKGVQFNVQTNAVLINDSWLDVFSRHQIHVGISIDGPRSQHNAHRVDRRGRGTFDSMVQKIAALKQAVDEGRLPGFGAICVVGPQSDARATYECLTKELGISKLRFLFPDDTHDSVNVEHIDRFVKFTDALFECWANDESRIARINLIDRTLQGILDEKVGHPSSVGMDASEAVTFTVSSAGDIGHDDTLRNVVPDLFKSGMNVRDAKFPEFLAWHSMVSGILTDRRTPTACASCAWHNICVHVTRNDTPLYRMKNNIVDQPSIYCEPLKTAYMKGATFLAQRGIPIERISQNLLSNP